MPYKLDCARAPDGSPCVLIQSAPEPMLAVDLLRMLKAGFPDEYRIIWYEPVMPVDLTGGSEP